MRMVAEVRPNYPTEWTAMKAVATKLGIGAAETVRTLLLGCCTPPQCRAKLDDHPRG